MGNSPDFEWQVVPRGSADSGKNLDLECRRFAGLERRVMIEVARRAIERSRRRAKFSLVASLSMMTLATAACVAVVVWFPTNVTLSVDFDAVFDSVVAGIKALLS